MHREDENNFLSGPTSLRCCERCNFVFISCPHVCLTKRVYACWSLGLLVSPLSRSRAHRQRVFNVSTRSCREQSLGVEICLRSYLSGRKRERRAARCAGRTRWCASSKRPDAYRSAYSCWSIRAQYSCLDVTQPCTTIRKSSRLPKSFVRQPHTQRYIDVPPNNGTY